MTEMTETDAAERENLWEKEMLQIYDDAAAIGYEASGFRGLVASHGPLRAAKMLINMDEPSDGFIQLWELKRLDISVEARAMRPEFRGLSRIRSSRFVADGWPRTSGCSIRRGGHRVPSFTRKPGVPSDFAGARNGARCPTDSSRSPRS